MGCDHYNVSSYRDEAGWVDATIKSSEGDDANCLCTFPYNEPDYGISNEDIQSLAMLGALVVYCHHGYTQDDLIYFPSDVPEWLQEVIRRRIR